MFVACSLLLQKPSRTSKPKEHSTLLERRLQLWHEARLGTWSVRVMLFRVTCPLVPQTFLILNWSGPFANLMFEGKTSATLKLITGHQRSCLLQLNEQIDPSNPNCLVRDILKEKHPPAQPLSQDCLISEVSESAPFHHIISEAFNGPMIRSAALRTFGVASPSGVDARSWRHFCTSFHAASNDLCEAMALFAHQLCTIYLSPILLSPFLSCRLIALDKCPCVRPIGVCEVASRIVAKAALCILRDDIQAVAGPCQLCAGQIAGVEAAVHAVRSSFDLDDTEGVQLMNASNAFNSLNRAVPLQNIRQLCPSFAPILINTYRSAAALYTGGDTLFSEEGTTQRDPLAMPMYALATLHLSDRLPNIVTQVWYVDDVCSCGSIVKLHDWWDCLHQVGPGFGYNVNVNKTWLVTKPSFHSYSSLALMCTLPVTVGLILGLQLVLGSFAKSSWMMGLRCGLLKYFYCLKLQRANRMQLLTSHADNN